MAITKNAVRLRALGNTGDGVEIAQPERGMAFNYETTYTEDSGRVQSGTAIVVPIFTVKSYSYTRTHPTVDEVKQILSYILNGKKYEMYAFNPASCAWGWDVYYTGKGDMSIGYLTPDGGHYDSFSFNAVGVKPI